MFISTYFTIPVDIEAYNRDIRSKRIKIKISTLDLTNRFKFLQDTDKHQQSISYRLKGLAMERETATTLSHLQEADIFHVRGFVYPKRNIPVLTPYLTSFYKYWDHMFITT